MAARNKQVKMAAVASEQEEIDPADIRPDHMMDGKGLVPQVLPDAPAQQIDDHRSAEAQAAIAMTERHHAAFLRRDGGGEDICRACFSEIAEMTGFKAEQTSTRKRD